LFLLDFVFVWVVLKSNLMVVTPCFVALFAVFIVSIAVLTFLFEDLPNLIVVWAFLFALPHI